MTATGTTTRATPRSSIAWGQTDRDGLRPWAACTGYPAVTLAADALARIAVDSVGAVRGTRPWMAPPSSGAVFVPPAGRHHVRFQQATVALDDAFGGALAVAPEVMVLVRAALAQMT